MISNGTAGDISSQEHRIWFAVIVTECIMIFAINAVTLLAFARNQNLRKRSTYLIINMTVADLLGGVVSEPIILWSIPELASVGKLLEFLIFYNIFQISSLTKFFL